MLSHGSDHPLDSLDVAPVRFEDYSQPPPATTFLFMTSRQVLDSKPENVIPWLRHRREDGDNIRLIAQCVTKIIVQLAQKALYKLLRLDPLHGAPSPATKGR